MIYMYEYKEVVPWQLAAHSMVEGPAKLKIARCESRENKDVKDESLKR